MRMRPTQRKTPSGRGTVRNKLHMNGDKILDRYNNVLTEREAIELIRLGLAEPTGKLIELLQEKP